MKYKGVAIDTISIFSTPGVYLDLTALLLKDAFLWLKNFIIKRGILLFIVTLTWLLVSNVDALQVTLNSRRLLRMSSISLPTGSSWELHPQLDLELDCIPLSFISARISPKLPSLQPTVDICRICCLHDGPSITLLTAKVRYYSYSHHK
jgi:hypothetical protein